MTRQEIEEQILNIVSEVMGTQKDKLALSTSFKDLGADSLTILDIMMKCEDTFQITISDEETENIKNIGNAVNYIHTHIAKK